MLAFTVGMCICAFQQPTHLPDFFGSSGVLLPWGLATVSVESVAFRGGVGAEDE